MHVRDRGTARSRRVELRIYEPPRFFEAFLRGRALHRAARHHRAHLRHLPGRLPDERLRGDRGRLRRDGARADPAAAAAPLLRRVDREPRAARVHAPRARLPRLRERGRDGARPPRGGRARAADQEGRQRDRAGWSAAARSTRSTCASAASTARRRGASSPPLAEQLKAARELALEAVALDGRRSTSRTSSRTTSSSRCRSPASTRSSAAGSRRAAASTSGRRSTRSTSTRSRCRTRTRCTRVCAARARTSSGRSPATRSTRRSSRRSPARRPPRPGCGPVCRNPFQSIVVRARRDPLRLRRGAPDHRRRTSEPERAGGRGRAARGHRLRLDRGAARHALAPLPPRRGRHDPRRARSSRRPRRTSARSRRTCSASCGANVDLRRRGAAAALRAGDPQLRPLHLLRHPLPRARGRPRADGSSSASGNEWRGDDGAGLEVARRLRAAGPRARSSGRASRST